MPEENNPQPTSAADTGQQGNAQPTATPSGGQRIIQPLTDQVSGLPQPQPLSQTIPSQGTPGTSLPVQPVVSAPVSPQAATPVNGQVHVDGQAVAYSANSLMLQEKHRLPWLRIIKWALPLVALIAIGAVLAMNQNLRATVFRQKYMTYSYPVCKTHICTIKFYKGSKIASYRPWSPPGQPALPASMSLLSPVIDGKTYVAMRIDAYDKAVGDSAASKQLLDAFSTCGSPGLTTGFTDYLPNLDTNANVCAIPSDNHQWVIGYATAFTSQKTNTFIVIVINENFSLDSQGHTSPVFNLADHQDEIQTILASLNVDGT